MATTVQVSEETKQLLGIIKEKEAQPSFDAVILHLISKHEKVPRSMLGVLPKKFRMTKQDKKEFFHEL